VNAVGALCAQIRVAERRDAERCRGRFAIRAERLGRRRQRA